MEQFGRLKFTRDQCATLLRRYCALSVGSATPLDNVTPVDCGPCRLVGAVPEQKPDTLHVFGAGIPQNLWWAEGPQLGRISPMGWH